MYNELIKNIHATDTSELLNKKDYNTNIKNIEDQVPSFTNLATTAAPSVVENKIFKISYLIKKTCYDLNM